MKKFPPELLQKIREKINIIAIAQGSSELTIGIVVRIDKLDAAVRAVHKECQLGKIHSAALASSSRDAND